MVDKILFWFLIKIDKLPVTFLLFYKLYFKNYSFSKNNSESAITKRADLTQCLSINISFIT